MRRKQSIYLLVLYGCLLFGQAICQEDICAHHGACNACVADSYCTWCKTSNNCVMLDSQCEQTADTCSSKKVATIGIVVAMLIYVVMGFVMVASYRFLRSRIRQVVLSHELRTDISDYKVFGDQAIDEALESLHEEILWCDVSVARSRKLPLIPGFAFLVLGLVLCIVNLAESYNTTVFLFLAFCCAIPSIMYVVYALYKATWGKRYDYVNALTHRGAYIITFILGPFVQFYEYSSMYNVHVIDLPNDTGNLFFGVDKSMDYNIFDKLQEKARPVGFKRIPKPNDVLRIINQRMPEYPKIQRDAPRHTLQDGGTSIPLMSRKSVKTPLMPKQGVNDYGATIDDNDIISV